MSSAWFPVILLGIVVYVALFWVAILAWAHRPSRATSGSSRRRNDGTLTPMALETLIYERTQLGSAPDRSTALGLIWSEQRRGEQIVQGLKVELTEERLRVSQLTKELRMTQDVLADVVQRLTDSEDRRRSSRLRSLLR